MYGLKNILSTQGFLPEQQQVILQLLYQAGCLEFDTLLSQLTSAGFPFEAIQPVLQCCLRATLTASGEFNPDIILNELATDHDMLLQKTQTWLQLACKKAFTEDPEKLHAHITEDMLQAFTSLAPKPRKNRYKAIIVLDTNTQSVYDALDYLHDLFGKQQMVSERIIIPATLTDDETDHRQLTGFDKYKRSNLDLYLQLTTATFRHLIQQDPALRHDNLVAYLNDLTASMRQYHAASQSDQIPLFYRRFYLLWNSNDILVITTEPQTDLHREFIRQSNESDLIEYLSIQQTPSLTRAGLLTRLTETCCLPECKTPPASEKSVATLSTPAANAPSLPAHATSYKVAFGLAAVGLFAINSPEVINASVELTTLMINEVIKFTANR